MKKYLLFLLILIACTEKEGKIEQTIPAEVEVPEQEHWIVYEGVVRSDAGNDIRLELSLLQGEVGLVSKYTTEEEFISSIAKGHRILSRGSGVYTLQYGASNSEMIIRIQNHKVHSFGWISGSYGITPENEKSKELRENAKITNLMFMTRSNSDELILVNERLEPLSDDDHYTLKKRSRLFTVEGLLTISPDGKHGEFYEINTLEAWSVAKVGAYGEVKALYTELAAEKHEGIYTRAVAYYVDDVDNVGKEIQSLVIKKIIEMQSYENMNKRREFIGFQNEPKTEYIIDK